MTTIADDEKLESILYETSNVELYKIPSPNTIKRGGDSIQEYHDINRWDLTRENLVFKGILRVKEQEIFSVDDEESDSESEDGSLRNKTVEEESNDRFRLIVEFRTFEDQKVWATIRYHNLSPRITTIDDTSFYSIQPVLNSGVFSTYLEVGPDLKIGLGLKFPNRVESSNFQMVLNNFLKDLANYTKMIENNANRANEYKGDNFNDEINGLSEHMDAVQFNSPRANDTGCDRTDSEVHVREVESSGDDDDFGDFIGNQTT